MKRLTTAEEQIMQVLWQIQKGFVKDILLELPDPKPAYNTVSTIIRILEKKQIISYHAFGKAHQYYPLVSKSDYMKSTMKGFVREYFSNSYKEMLSFFAKEEKMSIMELEDLLEVIKTESNPPLK
jgi:BlaI family transcriptional regulator, penicillinase repressor